MTEQSNISKRKHDHIEVCLNQPVEFQRKRTWFEDVDFVHQAVPACSFDTVDVSVNILGRKLSAPFLIGAMTGGTPEAREINRDLAAVCAAKGVGLALGSQRAMLEDESVTDSYRVRDIAPDILLLGNIGLAQVQKVQGEVIERLITSVGANGICLHLNPAMEIFQLDGDDLDGDGYQAIAHLCGILGERLIVKETGCGISKETAQRLVECGVRTLDVAGAGGVSWVRVENLRNEGPASTMAEFEEWGIPTAASLLEVRGLGVSTIASGGLRSGMDLAKSIALGATIGSAALPILRALKQNGIKGVGEWIDALVAGLKTAMVLSGCPDLSALRHAEIVMSGPLLEWAQQRCLWRTESGTPE